MPNAADSELAIMDNANAGRFVRLYADMILRISYLYLRQKQDAEDICQEVFLKLIIQDMDFETEEHEKAWIIRVTREIRNVEVQYNRTEHLMVPPDYVVDEETLEREKNDDHFAIAYGSSEPETMFFDTVQFSVNDIEYVIYSSDNVTGNTLFTIAEELIEES